MISAHNWLFFVLEYFNPGAAGTVVVHGMQFRLGDCVYVNPDQKNKRASARSRFGSPIYR